MSRRLKLFVGLAGIAAVVVALWWYLRENPNGAESAESLASQVQGALNNSSTKELQLQLSPATPHAVADLLRQAIAADEARQAAAQSVRNRFGDAAAALVSGKSKIESLPAKLVDPKTYVFPKFSKPEEPVHLHVEPTSDPERVWLVCDGGRGQVAAQRVRGRWFLELAAPSSATEAEYAHTARVLTELDKVHKKLVADLNQGLVEQTAFSTYYRQQLLAAVVGTATENRAASR